MKVKIGVEFNVPDVDEEDVAKAAASMAAYNYLSFCEISGVRTDTDEVTVHVDGYGECKVRLGEDHD
jgi:hypothetical protein